MRAKIEQPHLTGDNYKLWARQMPRPSASRKTAFLPASCMRICGIFPPVTYEKSPRKRWHKAKGTIKFPRQNSKNDGDGSLICKTSTVKVIGINKSGNILAHHFWKLRVHDRGEQSDDAVTAALRSSSHVFLPGSTTRLPPALPRSSFCLGALWCVLHLMLEENKLGELETRSSLFSQCCLFPGSLLTRQVQPRGLSLDLFRPTFLTDRLLARHEIRKIREGHDWS